MAGKKLTNLSPQSQEILKRIMKDKYAKRQWLYGKNGADAVFLEAPKQTFKMGSSL